MCDTFASMGLRSGMFSVRRNFSTCTYLTLNRYPDRFVSRLFSFSSSAPKCKCTYHRLFVREYQTLAPLVIARASPK
jgi:hypothetical protein